MKNDQIIRAWKDDEYRLSLGGDALSLLPKNPAGLMELTDDQLMDVDGGSTPICSLISAIASVVSAVSVTVDVATNAFSCWHSCTHTAVSDPHCQPAPAPVVGGESLIR